MAYHRHQLARAIREGRSEEEIAEMRYEIEYNERMDAWEPPERDDDEE